MVKARLHISSNTLCSYHQSHRLHMAAAGEHVHRLDGLDGEAAGGKAFYVPGQGGGVAGDVDHTPGAGGEDSVDDLGVAALAGRVHGETVDPLAFSHQLGQGFLRRGAEEGSALDAVASGIFLGVLHCFWDNLDADDLPGLPGQQQADGAYAAVDVRHGFIGLRRKQLQVGPVELLGLARVHLQEGPGAHLESKVAKGLPQGGLAG